MRRHYLSDGVHLKSRIRFSDEDRRWVSRDHSIRAHYFIANSIELSKEQFRLLTEALQVGSKPIEGVGDEARLLEPAPSGERRLNFRRGRVVIQLAAPGPGEETIRRLAGLLVDQVDWSNKAGELDKFGRSLRCAWPRPQHRCHGTNGLQPPFIRSRVIFPLDSSTTFTGQLKANPSMPVARATIRSTALKPSPGFNPSPFVSACQIEL